MQEDQNITKSTLSAQALDGSSKVFCIICPDGSRVHLCRTTAEWSAAAGDILVCREYEGDYARINCYKEVRDALGDQWRTNPIN